MSSLIDLCLAEPSLIGLWDYTRDHGFVNTGMTAAYGTEFGHDVDISHDTEMGLNWTSRLNGKTGASFLFYYQRAASAVNEYLFWMNIEGPAPNAGFAAVVQTTNEMTCYARSRKTDAIQSGASSGASITGSDKYQLGYTVDFSGAVIRGYKNGTSIINSTGKTFGATSYLSDGSQDDTDVIWGGWPSAARGQKVQGSVYLAAVFDTVLAAAKWTAFNGATQIGGSARWREGDKLATLGNSLSGLADGTYRMRVYDSPDRALITRIVWNGDITVTGGTSSTQVRTALATGQAAYCVITSQAANQLDPGATNTVACPLVLNHV